MKSFYFNVQAKGGAGKSMLTYLQALKKETDLKAVFVDLDSSTKTSCRQLKFLKDTERILEVNIFDNLRKIEREKLFTVVEALCATSFDEFYIDFGAPESEQLPGIFSMDFNAVEFKIFEKELNVKFVFNVILAGGTSYAPSFEYLKRLTELLEGKFELVAFVNEFTFQNYPQLIDEIKLFAKQTKGWIKEVRMFGDIHVERNSGQLITENIKEGIGFSGYNSFAAKTIIKREIAKV